jgi:hypothetical protein
MAETTEIKNQFDDILEGDEANVSTDEGVETQPEIQEEDAPIDPASVGPHSSPRDVQVALSIVSVRLAAARKEHREAEMLYLRLSNIYARGDRKVTLAEMNQQAKRIKSQRVQQASQAAAMMRTHIPVKRPPMFPLTPQAPK